MLENFGVFRYPDRMERQIGVIDELRARHDRGIVIEDKGSVFNSDLTQAIELGYMLDLAAVMLQAGLARAGVPGRALAPVGLPRSRRRELPQAFAHPLGERRAAARVRRGAHDQVGTDGEVVLMRQSRHGVGAVSLHNQATSANRICSGWWVGVPRKSGSPETPRTEATT